MATKRKSVWKYREDGRPFWRIAWYDERGKMRRKSTGTDDGKEAEDQRADQEADLNNGRYHAPDETTWTEFVEAYIEEGD